MDRVPAVGMPSAVIVLPDDRLGALKGAYRAAGARKRTRLIVGTVVLLVLVSISAWVAEIDPATVWNKLGGFTSYFDRLATLDTGARVWTDPVDWFWGLRKWLLLVAETLLMAYVGTLSGAVAAFVLCFAASRITCPNPWIRFLALRGLEFCRTVPPIVFALVFVIAFGIGPLPGVMALAVHTTGALGKLFAETVDEASPRPVEGLRASGATLLETIRFGILPQVLAGFGSYAMLRFEVNLRDATVLGFVGAGGIGFELFVAIERFYYSDVSAILVLIILTVFLLDLATERLRRRLFPGETH